MIKSAKIKNEKTSARETLGLELQKKLGIKNINAIPKINKVIVAIGIGSLATRKWLKDFDEFEKNLMKITWQKPRMIKSRKSISNFKLREDMPVMLQTTLRGRRASDFLDRFTKLVLPRIRDFSWISEKSFDGKWNISIWIPNYNIFPELNVDEVVTPIGIQITITMTGNKSAENRILLESLWFMFK